MKTTIEIEVEYTDTFGGEPNFSWVRRETIHMPEDASSRAIMRAAKRAMGLTGMKGRRANLGDAWEFAPYKSATIMRARVLTP